MESITPVQQLLSREESALYARKPIEERLWSRIEKSGGQDACWPWLGYTVKGYGRLMYRGKRVMAHRVAYELTYGPVDEELDVLHHCDNPPCCNPAHLFKGTNDDNVADKVSKGRQADNHREHNPKAKLTEADVAEVRELWRAGWSATAIAARFGVARGTIWFITNNLTWPDPRTE